MKNDSHYISLGDDGTIWGLGLSREEAHENAYKRCTTYLNFIRHHSTTLMEFECDRDLFESAEVNGDGANYALVGIDVNGRIDVGERDDPERFAFIKSRHLDEAVAVSMIGNKLRHPVLQLLWECGR